jgi:primosomal protein N'
VQIFCLETLRTPISPYNGYVHIVTVIPIARGIPFDVLTYYAPVPLRPGTLVKVPLGRQSIHGFVTETAPLKDLKAFVKNATFSLKKISAVVSHIPYFEAVTTALKATGTQTLAPVGAVAAAVIPQILFEYLSPEKISSILPTETIAINSEQSVLGTRSDRIDVYKRMIRSAFAEKKSVLFVAPTIRALEWWMEMLSKGITRHALVFHSKVGKKVLRSQFASMKNETIPHVFFCTPGFSVMPTQKLGVIIIEDESSFLYHSTDRYEIDTRVFFATLAHGLGAALVWGDTMPRFATLHRTKQDHIPRTYVPEKLRIVPIEPYRTILPGEAIELIRHAEKRKRRLFIYTNRKGVAPLSRCADCGTVVQCPECEMPMALRNRRVNGQVERQFICLHCATMLPSDHHCVVCNSWNIIPVAIGTESIRDAVSQIVGAEAVTVIDDDVTPDSKTIEDLLERLKKQKFAVIIGTQKALPYLDKVGYALIPFFDRLLSTPSLYTTESILRLIMECNEIVSESVVICTKIPDFPTIRQLEMQKINDIVRDELELRRQLGYPPFGTLLKITMTVPEGYRQEIVLSMQEYFQEFDIAALPARRISMGSMKVLLAWLVKVKDDYVEEEGSLLIEFLERLRFPYKVEQNPERL